MTDTKAIEALDRLLYFSENGVCSELEELEHKQCIETIRQALQNKQSVDVDMLVVVIKQTLIGHCLVNIRSEDDDCGYSLIDALTYKGQTVDKGYEEIDYIIDSLFYPIKEHLNEQGHITDKPRTEK